MVKDMICCMNGNVCERDASPLQIRQSTGTAGNKEAAILQTYSKIEGILIHFILIEITGILILPNQVGSLVLGNSCFNSFYNNICFTFFFNFILYVILKF